MAERPPKAALVARQQWQGGPALKGANLRKPQQQHRDSHPEGEGQHAEVEQQGGPEIVCLWEGLHRCRLALWCF